MAKSTRFSHPVEQYLQRGRRRPDQPLKGVELTDRQGKGVKARQAAAKSAPAAPAQPGAKPAAGVAPKVMPSADKPGRVRPLDGEGRPYITLAQFMKKHELAESGGQAKSIVRVGGILVNGSAENRPGRKLHAGDLVRIGGKDYRVEL
jgi:ribosome-associated protein